MKHIFSIDNQQIFWQPIRLRASIYIEYQENVLLVFDPYYLNGSWILPGGGAEFSELIHEAAVREVREETGIRIEIEGLWKIREIWEPETECSKKFLFKRKSLEMIFFGKYIDGEINSSSNPVNDSDSKNHVKYCKWIKKETIGEQIEGYPVYPKELLVLIHDKAKNIINTQQLFLNPIYRD